jgi:uncharacterized protein YidB (DUF937 family)
VDARALAGFERRRDRDGSPAPGSRERDGQKRLSNPKGQMMEGAMSLFDQLLGGLIGQLGGGQQKNALLDLAASVIQNQPGGLAGLVEQFTRAGLGDHANSWVGTGANMPLSPDQLTAALGRGNVDAMSQRLGIPTPAVTAGLAALLPHLVDQLTPRGEVARDQDLAGTLTALLGQHKG